MHDVWRRHIGSDRERARRWAAGRGCYAYGIWIEMGNRDPYIDRMAWTLRRREAAVWLWLRRHAPWCDADLWARRVCSWLPMPNVETE